MGGKDGEIPALHNSGEIDFKLLKKIRENPDLIYLPSIFEALRYLKNKRGKPLFVKTICSFQPHEIREHLLTALDSVDEHMRRISVSVMKRLTLNNRLTQEESFREIFITLVADADPVIRSHAITSLATFNDKESKSLIIQALEDESIIVQIAAIKASENFEPSATFFNRFLACFFSEIPEFNNWAVGYATSKISPNSDFDLSDEFMMKVITAFDEIKGDRRWKPENYSFCQACVALIAYCGGEKGIDFLAKVVNDHHQPVSFHAIRGLSRWEDERAVNALILQLRAPVFNTRMAAVEALSINGGLAAMWEFTQIIANGKDTYLIPHVENAMKRLSG